jgi:high-affinity nickel-transport protein
MMEFSALWLMFVLGLRHGLDPDHIAIIDNVVFRTAEARPRLAPWTGTLFAVGHSISVAVVAVGVSFLAGAFALPGWTAAAVDTAVIALLLLVGTMNLSALLRRDKYIPAGWRSRLLPSRLRASTHPGAVIAIGIIFGLVFDTATQAAAWGAAATAAGGTLGALSIAAAFAVGMITADTIDSQIVARLLRRASAGSAAKVERYRRAVGWIVVVLSYGMAALALGQMAGFSLEMDETLFSGIGVGAAVLVILLAGGARLAARSRTASPSEGG